MREMENGVKRLQTKSPIGLWNPKYLQKSDDIYNGGQK